jgi:hypothetical protein
MKTSDLIDLLAGDALAVAPGQVGRKLAAALAIGGAASLSAVALWLRCQPLLMAAAQPWFWTKTAYTLLLTIAGIAIVRRLAVPGAPVRRAPWLALAVIAGMGLLAAAQLQATPPALWEAVWLGRTWKVCTPLILLLALPIYAALVVAVRGLAPVRLRLAGSAIGFAAGALAATLYGLHCPEQDAVFVMCWYSLGILASTALGALTGPRLLRW